MTGDVDVVSTVTETTKSTTVTSSFRKTLLAESITTGVGGRSYDDDCLTAANSSSSSSSEQVFSASPSFPQGFQFSPDGTCLLTAKANRLELYNTPYCDNKEDEDDANDNKKKEDTCRDRDQQNKQKNDIEKNIWEPELICNGGDTVRSYTWYPHMRSSDPATCCFLGVSRDSPVHLYDAYDGSIRATYCPYNRLDEMESPTTLCFVENGRKIVTGGLKSDRLLHIFDINRPGREHSPPILKLGKTRRSKDGQKGLVSAMAYSESRGVIAIGTYSPGSIYLYDLRTYSKSAVAEVVMSSSTSTSFSGSVCVVGHGKREKKNNNKRKRFVPTIMGDDNNGSSNNITNTDNDLSSYSSSMNFSAAKKQWYCTRTRGGVTQVEFDDSGNGHYLFSTSRRSNAILQWDLRKISSSNYCPGIASFETENNTNQRIEFQVYGDQLWTGGRDGCVRVYSHRNSTSEISPLLAKIDGFRDCVNGISLHSESTIDTQLLVSKMNDEGSNNTSDDKDRNSTNVKKSLLAVAIGSRQFPSDNDWENDDPHISLTNRTHQYMGSAQVYSVY